MSDPRQQKRKDKRTTRRVSVTPAIRLPAGRFRPPHCPNRHCDFYLANDRWRWTHWGFYSYRIHPRPLPRYQCASCRRTFTARTFSSTYWLHRWDLFTQIAALSVAGSGLRQIARSLGVAHSTVQRHLSRGGRHCLVTHRQMIDGKAVQEPVVFDGFETFEYSQYFPCHYNLAVGAESWFIYHFTDSPLRRKGSMTDEQKTRRAQLETELGRPNPKAVEEGILELLRTVVKAGRMKPRGSDVDVEAVAAPLVLRSDEHPAYVRALRRLAKEPDTPSFVHQVTPGSAARTGSNPLFSVNLVDLLVRHCGANHRRETIAYNVRRQGGLERLAIFSVWRNAIKARAERHPGTTAAMSAGILDRPWGWRDLFSRRRFPREEELPGCWWSYYWREIKTLALGERQTVHRRKFAF